MYNIGALDISDEHKSQLKVLAIVRKTTPNKLVTGLVLREVEEAARSGEIKEVEKK